MQVVSVLERLSCAGLLTPGMLATAASASAWQLDELATSGNLTTSTRTTINKNSRATMDGDSNSSRYDRDGNTPSYNDNPSMLKGAVTAGTSSRGLGYADGRGAGTGDIHVTREEAAEGGPSTPDVLLSLAQLTGQHLVMAQSGGGCSQLSSAQFIPQLIQISVHASVHTSVRSSIHC